MTAVLCDTGKLWLLTTDCTGSSRSFRLILLERGGSKSLFAIDFSAESLAEVEEAPIYQCRKQGKGEEAGMTGKLRERQSVSVGIDLFCIQKSRDLLWN